jgi:protoporphyrinogen IX oxidase
MTEWLIALVPLFKTAHIAALVIWCGGLLVLPLMLARHDPTIDPADYAHLRRSSHIIYTICVTPTAVIAVIAGTWLIFLRDVFVPWLYAKLAFVALLVAVHAWIGHILNRTAEEPGNHRPPSAVLTVGAVMLPVVAVLSLVLAKPAMDWLVFPDWLLSPRGGDLPIDVPADPPAGATTPAEEAPEAAIDAPAGRPVP